MRACNEGKEKNEKGGAMECETDPWSIIGTLPMRIGVENNKNKRYTPWGRGVP